MARKFIQNGISPVLSGNLMMIGKHHLRIFNPWPSLNQWELLFPRHETRVSDLPGVDFPQIQEQPQMDNKILPEK